MDEMIPQKILEQKIFLIRKQKVMIDRDLAELYGVETKALTRAVRRNIDRFPEDFMFQLTNQEVINLKYHFGTSSWGGTRKLPLAFTENGIAMLSSVLRSKTAIHVNIQIMRTFTKLRELMATHKDLKTRIDQMEQKYDSQFRVVFQAIKQLIEPPQKKKKQIGFGRE